MCPQMDSTSCEGQCTTTRAGEKATVNLANKVMVVGLRQGAALGVAMYL